MLSSVGYVLNHCLQWHRVIVDEAHQIRNRLTSEFEVRLIIRFLTLLLGVSNAMVDLDATYRWCLTGCALYQSKCSSLSDLWLFQHTDHQHAL